MQGTATAVDAKESNFLLPSNHIQSVVVSILSPNGVKNVNGTMWTRKPTPYNTMLTMHLYTPPVRGRMVARRPRRTKQLEVLLRPEPAACSLYRVGDDDPLSSRLYDVGRCPKNECIMFTLDRVAMNRGSRSPHPANLHGLRSQKA